MPGEKPTIHIVGAGLAGSECALQLAGMGYQVVLIEMRGSGVTTPAHQSEDFAELVCSNSFGSLAGSAAPGELKWEAEQLGSQVLAAAFEARVPAGQALGMDRTVFARAVTARVSSSPNIRVERREVLSLDEIPRPCVVATGPLTGGSLASSMATHFGDEFLYFFDAIAPIIEADSVNMDIAWRADRWDKGTRDYINCPMQKNDYFSFIEAMKAAKKIEAKDFEKDTPYFDGCMPIEEMLHRGDLTPRFGPMSAKGLTDPRTGKWPFAVVQLRQDNREATAYNIVGFQTKMAYADQKTVFRMIPGLEGAEFLKLGSIHRNLYINTPRRLNRDLSSQKDPWLFFAGQITGVEGYFESTCMGLMVSRFMHAKIAGDLALDGINVSDFAPPRATAFGSLLDAITDPMRAEQFQPTNINFGHMPAIQEPEPEVPLNGKKRRRLDKNTRRTMQIANARAGFKSWMTLKGLASAPHQNVERAAADLQTIIDAAKAAEVAARAEQRSASDPKHADLTISQIPS
jgi:methylenetetrahydrofolate--tRNA-(uracil-5-)-methyltransferase